MHLYMVKNVFCVFSINLLIIIIYDFYYTVRQKLARNVEFCFFLSTYLLFLVYNNDFWIKNLSKKIQKFFLKKLHPKRYTTCFSGKKIIFFDEIFVFKSFKIHYYRLRRVNESIKVGKRDANFGREAELLPEFRQKKFIYVVRK